MKWIKRIAGVLICLQCIGLYAGMTRKIIRYFNGWDNVLLKALILGLLGTLCLLLGWYLIKSSFDNNIEEDKDYEKKHDEALEILKKYWISENDIKYHKYESYLPYFLKLAKSHSHKKLTKHLQKTAIRSIGIEVKKDTNEKVSSKLIELYM